MVKFSVATVTVVNEKNVTAAKSQRLKIEGSSWWLLVFRNCVFFDVVVPSKRTLVVYNVCLISLMFRFVWQLCKTSKLPKPTKPLELTPRFWSQGSQVGSRTIAARCASKVVGMVSHGQLILVNAQVLGEREKLQIGCLWRISIFGDILGIDLIWFLQMIMVDVQNRPTCLICRFLRHQVMQVPEIAANPQTLTSLENWRLIFFHVLINQQIETPASVFVHFPFFHQLMFTYYIDISYTYVCV